MRRAPGILLLYHHPRNTRAATIMDHVSAFERYSKHSVVTYNILGEFEPEVRELSFDIVVLHYSLFGMKLEFLTPRWREYLKRCTDSYVVAFFQDEYCRVPLKVEFLRTHPVNCVYTIYDAADAKRIYLDTTPVERCVETLTGYVSDESLVAARKFTLPLNRRSVDIAYRGRKLPYYLGAGAQEKWLIAREFQKRAPGYGLKVDLGWEEEDRIYGDDWYEFLGSSRATLGTESGATISDLDGTLVDRHQKILASEPSISFEEMHERLLAPHEGNLPLRSISPRCFEAATMRTTQIMFEGKYSGIVEPMTHYFPLKKDYSNFDNAVDFLRDDAAVGEMSERAYQDLIASGRFTFRRFIEDFDRDLETNDVAQRGSFDEAARLTKRWRNRGALRYTKIRAKHVAWKAATYPYFRVHSRLPEPWQRGVSRQVRRVTRRGNRHASQAAKPQPTSKGRILFIGTSFYNNWYASRALRKRGWEADVFFGDDSEIHFSHQVDYFQPVDAKRWSGPDGDHVRMMALVTQWTQEYRQNLHSLPRASLQSLRTAAVAAALEVTLHSPVAEHDRAFRLLFEPAMRALQTEHQPQLLGQLLKSVLSWLSPDRPPGLTPLLNIADYDIIHFTGIGTMRFLYYVAPWLFESTPMGWDIDILKRLGKKIVYTNIGCCDGVSQTAFASWGDEPVCGICRWQDEPTVCSDERNLAWGRMRNHLADYQILLGGNRVDYNDAPSVNEVPEFYCLDPDVWHPDLEIPRQHRLDIPEGRVGIYHGVGNYDLRTTADKTNIKTSHIVLPTVERLKADGQPVELVFCTDVPSPDVRFYQSQAEIVVDMLTYGWFGANIREAMMLGKVAVCYLRPEWLDSMRHQVPDYVDELPVVSATPETIYDVLADLVRDRERRETIGRRSRQFALKWHSTEAAGRRLDELYSQLLSH